MKADPLPLVAGTLQTDPRSGGIKRSSGVNVLPIVAESEFYRSTVCPNYYFPFLLPALINLYLATYRLVTSQRRERFICRLDISWLRWRQQD